MATQKNILTTAQITPSMHTRMSMGTSRYCISMTKRMGSMPHKREMP